VRSPPRRPSLAPRPRPGQCKWRGTIEPTPNGDIISADTRACGGIATESRSRQPTNATLEGSPRPWSL